MNMCLVTGCLLLGVSISGDGVPASGLHAWTLVVASDAIASERYAAEELQGFIASVTGAAAPAISEVPAATRNIFVGPGGPLQTGAPEIAAREFDDEELFIRIEEDIIVITGGRPRGTLYGVYEFAERYLGVRFLTWDHTHIPVADASVLIPLEEHRFNPPFSFRWSYYFENTAQPAFAARLRNNTVTRDERFGGVTPQSLINHSYFRYLNPETYGESHPEYFALVDGERRLDIGGGGPEPCVTHPEVIRIMTEGILADLRANPQQRNISLSQNDNDAYCCCERCEAINQAEGTPMGANLYLVNAVAEAVEQEFPEVKIGTLSYWYTRKPPQNMKPRQNVQIQLCSIECSVIHALDDPAIEKNREFCADLEAWGRICKDIWIWDYNTNFAAYDLPFANLRTITPNVRFFLRNNVHGVFMQANGNGNAGEMSDLRNYVMSRCLWNPELEDWELVEEFCRLHYGAVGETVLEYLAYMHEVAQTAGHTPTCFGATGEFGITEEVATRALDYFGRALTLAETDIVRGRLEKASIAAYRAFMETGTYYHYEDGMVRMVLPEKYADVFERYVDLCTRHNMTHASENELIGVLHAQVRAYMDGVPGQRMESDVWRLTAAPSHNGAVAELFHKPSGRHLLATWNRGGIRHSGGTLQEIVEQDPYEGVSYQGIQEDGALVLSRTIEDDATLTRRISLEGNLVRIENTIVKSGSGSGVYQLRVRPEWDVATTTSDCSVLGAYILDGEIWRKVNCGWQGLEGPDASLLRSSSGGAFAFFNHKENFGVLQTYAPEQFAFPRLWMHPERSQLNLELVTRSVTLSPGESYSYAYTCELIAELPR